VLRWRPLRAAKSAIAAPCGALSSAKFYMTRTDRRDRAAFPINIYDPDCRRCTRLAAFLGRVHAEHPSYHCRPVPPFGAADASLVIVGLAPGMHGANATGRPFTGDYAGELLYATLHKFGFATRPRSVSASDSLRLTDARITNAVKCLPPENRPLPAEVKCCNAYLSAELATLRDGASILALGHVAHSASLLALGVPPRKHKFVHGAVHLLDRDIALFDSYHCSRYNTNTRRLTPAMFERVFAAIADRNMATKRTDRRATTSRVVARPA
jgi:uracil-DNA glycosylase family 4